TTAPGAKLSFYKSLGDKIRLYDGGGTSNYGIGIQDVETQFYVESTAHFSFNSGGSLQASGVNEVMRIMASGNVGIGTTAPAQALDVVGAIRSSNQLISTVSTGTAPLSVASTTLVTNLNAQYLNGQLGSYYLPSANVSGTATYMAKFTSGNTIGNSIVYDNGTNVGVGTTNPGTALDVVGAIRSSGQLMSTVAIGTAPLSVVSTTLVTNLNAQYLNGQQGSYYMPSTTDSWVNTIGDTMTGSLVFSGISNDITTNGAEHLSLMPGGNVGIGTTSPDAKLEVAGGIIGTTFNGVGISGTGSIALGSYALTVSNNAAINQSLRTIDTPTFAGLSLYGQLTSSVSTGTAPFSIASTTLVSNLNADLLDGQHGSYYAAASSVSGISGYIPKFTGSGTIGNSVMYTDGTNVGIGTTAPAYKMEVAGTLGITNPLSSTWVPAMYANAPNLANGQNYFISVGKSATAFNNASLNYHHAGDGSASNYGSLGMNSRSDILVFNASGYVGIGTTAPGSQLEIYQSSAQRLLLSGANINLASSNTITPLVVVNGTGGATLLQLQENGGTLFMVTSSGNVGIGTTNPTQSLDVVGKIAISGTQMIYNANAAGFTGSLFFGNGGGSLSHTTGSEGYYNTGVGYSSLLSNNTGHDNSALGVNALISNNTGYNNTALGVSALYSNTTGYNNSALGVNAGRFISGGSVANVTSNSSLYLGNTTMALADGDTNEIVIGASATGIGSNSVVLGNDSITKTILKGNVGIGTTAPGAILDVLTSNNSQMVVHKTGFEYGNTGILFGASSTVNASIKGGIIFNYPSGSGFGIGDMHIALNNAATTSNVTMADAILTIKSSGNVGIGTTAPTQALDVAGNISLSGSLVMGGNTVIDSGGGWLRTYGSTGWYSGTYGGGWYMSDSSWIRNFGSKPLYMNGDGTYSGVFMNGNVGIGTTAPGAKLSFYKSLGDKIRLYDGGGTSNYGIGIQDVETQFYVQSTAHFSFNSGGSLQASGVNEVMRIMASGNVGIGTTAPGYKLDVAGSVIVSAGLRVGSASGNSYVGFVSGAGADSSAAGGSIYTASFSNPLYILTGNVGIGTTAPGSKLEVNGGIAATTFNGVGISGTGSLALGSYTLTVSNNAAINQNLRIIDAPTFAGVSLYGQLTSSVSTGTAPLSIASTTLVSNLNADLLDGQHGSYYAAASSVSGTSGYIPKFTGSGTIGNSVMYTDGTNVGIGTTAPGAKLDVVSVDNTPSTIAMRILSLNGTAGLQFGYSSISQKQTTNNINIDAGLSSGNIILQSSSSGNVGIGTTAPASLLSLSDTAVSTYNDALTILNPNSLVHSGSSILMNSGTTNGVRLYSELMNATVGSEKTSFNIQNYMNGTWIDRLMVRFDGNVGIGTTAPSYALDVSGAVRASGEVISTSNNSYRLIVGNYGTFLRSDGSYTYFLTTASGDQYGTFSALRPFTFSNSTGVVSMGNGFTASGGAISLNASSNYAVSIATGTSTGAVTIGGGLNTVAIDSSDWDITTAGAMTGISGISSNGSYTQTGTSANTFTGISTFSNATYSALFTGGNVGIGTTNPLQPLDIYRAPSDTPGSGSLGFSFASGTDGFGVRLSATGGPYDLNIDRYAGSTWVPALTLARTTGYLGIGTTAPTQALEVNGMLYLNNRQADGGDLILASSGYSSWSIDNSSGRLRHFYYTEEMASFYNNGGLSIGQSYSNVTPPGNGLLVQGGVGIGTTAPTYKLDVVGTVRTSGQFISSAVTGTAPLSVASTTLVSNLNVDLLDGQHGSYYAAASSISGTSGYIPKFTGSGTIGNSLIYNTGTYVGIGTTSPNYPLDIQSATKMNSKTGYLTNGADYAEYFYTDDTDLSPGETVCVDTLKSNAVKRCDRSGDNNVMGIVSTSPSIVGNGNGIKRENDPHYKIIGMIGQVPAKVSNDNGSISIGDSLTASSTAGVLRKADAGESTVGVAMQDFNSSKGTIQVLISRRNQSLTVEKVEESVEQNIADMNIQDQITKMVATAQDSLQQQLADNDSKLSEINSQLTINGERIESIDSTMKDLEKQIDTIKEQNQAIIDFSSALNIQSLVYKDVDGNLDLMEGKLEAAGIVAGAFTVKIVDTANKTIGEAYFCPAEKKYDNDKKDCESTSDSYYDGTKVKVMTGAVTSSAKIFTSFEGNPGSSSWIDKNSSDGNFEIKLAAPVAEKTKVNWWIVEEGK
ncbi:MAG: hypothetical protein HGB08_04370, partial [Candidatus Moranbacteria bacterium]|nr:hypothetical protein [Candidatus Moranbacteria bacterium]